MYEILIKIFFREKIDCKHFQRKNKFSFKEKTNFLSKKNKNFEKLFLWKNKIFKEKTKTEKSKPIRIFYQIRSKIRKVRQTKLSREENKSRSQA